jgi:hypothetical protein
VCSNDCAGIAGILSNHNAALIPESLSAHLQRLT